MPTSARTIPPPRPPTPPSSAAAAPASDQGSAHGPSRGVSSANGSTPLRATPATGAARPKPVETEGPASGTRRSVPASEPPAATPVASTPAATPATAPGRGDATQAGRADVTPYVPITPVSFGPYLLVARAGRGGMAEIFLATHRGLAGYRRLVVVKRLLPELEREATFLPMLLDEARLGGLMRHPSVVPVIDVGVVDGRHYVALELAEGMTLERLRVRSKGPATIPPGVAAVIARGLFESLAHVHEARDLDGTLLDVVHGDVSPSNVILGWEGQVRLIDLGIAESRLRTVTSTPGTLRGKPAYVAPEQIVGRGADRRADLFAAGAVMWELLTGQRLFKGPDPTSRLRAVLEQPIAPPSTLNPAVPQGLDAICLAALARDPADRPTDARTLAEAITRYFARHGATTEADVAAWLAKHHGDARADDERAMKKALGALGSRISSRPPPAHAPRDGETRNDHPLGASPPSERAPDGPAHTRTASIAIARAGVVRVWAERARAHALPLSALALAMLATLVGGVALWGDDGPAASASSPHVVHEVTCAAQPAAQPIAAPPPIVPEATSSAPVAVADASQLDTTRVEPTRPEPRPRADRRSRRSRRARARATAASAPQQSPIAHTTASASTTGSARERARAAYASGAFAEAARLYAIAAREAPGDARVFAGLGASRMRAGQTDAAIAAYRRAVALAPSDASLRDALQRAEARRRR